MDYTGKSVVIDKFGGYDCLKVCPFPLPELDGLVEVEVRFCGLNFADLYTRQGLIPHKCPFVLGLECCGTVRLNQSNDRNLKIGDKVICYNYNGGMYSDIIRIPPEQCYVIPQDVSFSDGAIIFVNYLTAYFALIEIGNLRDNQTIFLPSASGGLGLAAIQIAKQFKNVKMFCSASSQKHKYLEDMGIPSENIISSSNLHQLPSICQAGFDIILDTRSDSTSLFNSCLKPLGKHIYLGANNLITNENKISYLSMLKMWLFSSSTPAIDLIMNNRVVAGLHLGLLCEKQPEKVRQTLNVIVEWLREGKIILKIDSIWSLEDVVQATKILAERKNIGKVLLKL